MENLFSIAEAVFSDDNDINVTYVKMYKNQIFRNRSCQRSKYWKSKIYIIYKYNSINLHEQFEKCWLIKVFLAFELVNKGWNEIPFSEKKVLSSFELYIILGILEPAKHQ